MPNQQDKPKIFDDFSGGTLYDVSMFKMPEEVTPHSINMVFDEEIGAAKVRKGTAQQAAQMVNDKPVLGLANLRRRGDTNHALLAAISDGTNNDIYKVNDESKSLQDDTKDLKTRFCQFLDSIVRVNGIDAAKSFDGSSWITTGGVFDLANMPTGSFVVNYKDRVHTMSENGFLYSSSVPRFFLDYDGQSANFTKDATVTGGTSGATGIIKNDTDGGASGTLELVGVAGTFQNNEEITDDEDTPGTADVNGTGVWKLNWLDGHITTPIDPDNGLKGKATGFGKVGGLLLIFFERAMYSWNGLSTEADEIVGIGCSSQESVATDGGSGLLFFANKDGVFITRGGYPQKISRFVQPYFDNMSSANYEHIAGGCDGKHYFCSLGDVALNGRTIENVVLRYTIQSQEWAVLSYPTQPRVFATYIDGTDVKLLYGDNDGNVIELDSSDENDNYAAVTDVPIKYELDINDIWQPLQGIRKSIVDKIVVLSEDNSGAKLLYRIDSTKEEDWKTLGAFRENIAIMKNINIPKFNYCRLRIAGRSDKGRMIVRGIEIPNIKLHGYK